MNQGPLIFLGTFLAMATSWFTLVLSPHLQFGRAQQEEALDPKVLYPSTPAGEARQGAEVYRANGCVYCHSQQIDQTGVDFDITLSKPGTNVNELVEAVVSVDRYLAAFRDDRPIRAEQEVEAAVREGYSVASGLTLEQRDVVKKKLTDVKGGIEVKVGFNPRGADITRGWGARQSVARDFLYERPVQLGSLRLGPDLAAAGERGPVNSESWQLIHLYYPRLVVPDSKMPPYPFLFEEKPEGKSRLALALDPARLPKSLRPTPGYEIVPKPEALQLVAYLLNKRNGPSLPEAPRVVKPKPAPSVDDQEEQAP